MKHGMPGLPVHHQLLESTSLLYYYIAMVNSQWFSATEKAMAPHSSILAWKIPGVIFPPRKYLTMSGDILVVMTQAGGYYWHLVERGLGCC